MFSHLLTTISAVVLYISTAGPAAAPPAAPPAVAARGAPGTPEEPVGEGDTGFTG